MAPQVQIHLRLLYGIKGLMAVIPMSSPRCDMVSSMRRRAKQEATIPKSEWSKWEAFHAIRPLSVEECHGLRKTRPSSRLVGTRWVITERVGTAKDPYQKALLVAIGCQENALAAVATEGPSVWLSRSSPAPSGAELAPEKLRLSERRPPSWRLRACPSPATPQPISNTNDDQ